METIKNRYEFVYLFDVENGNPNGDPDAGNMPRMDNDTNKGLVTDVCLKRKIRNFVELAKSNKTPYEIHVREGEFLTEHHKQAHKGIENEALFTEISKEVFEEINKTMESLIPELSTKAIDNEYFLYLKVSSKMKDLEKKALKIKWNTNLKSEIEKVIKTLFLDSEEKLAKMWICKNFFDIRTFGAVMSTGDLKCGQVRGPVQLTFGKSIDEIYPKTISMSRTAAVSIDKPKDKGLGASKHIVPYALYRSEGYISAHLAEKTGFSEDDIELLWQSLINMFDHDHSAARGKMNARKLFVFKHSSALGNAPAHKLFDLIKVNKIEKEEDAPPRAFTDYKISIDEDNLPEGVKLINKL